MGELNSEGDVLAVEERSDSVSALKASPPADPASINEECLSAAEEAAEQVLNWVHPTLDAEEKRRDVIDYVQQLVKSHLNCEVVPYGSVPLKTYLPDGDIDLTILKGPNAEESLPHDVLSLLEAEEQNENAEYEVKDTQFIDAEVKLVKCLVQNIVVDVTFNQVGGLSTLCFLEQVDRLIGRNHIFKHSIILVKTWCYYESRILGAHHGLISTYALETLVLYIFHFFHSSLNGPLSVLYRFLDYYSQFDWENYCISLKGPVHKSSLPDIAAKMPENQCACLLLSEEFLEKSMELFSVPSRLDSNPKAFQPKHLNIIDPLKENNNLGRSVHQGNFYRIRSAFKYGASKLGRILLCPRDEIAEEIFSFFSDTRARHEHRYRSSTPHLALKYTDEESLTAYFSRPIELLSDDDSDGNSVSAEQISILESGSSENQLDSACDSEKCCFNTWLKNPEQHDNTLQWCMENCSCLTSSNSTSEGCRLENLSLDFRETDSSESEPFNPLADLTGDYDSDIRSLLRAQLCHGFALSAAPSANPSSPPNIQKEKAWDIVPQPKPHNEEAFARMDVHLFPTDHVNYGGVDSALLASAFFREGTQKPRGLGTYFPDMSVFYSTKPSQWRGRNHQNHHNSREILPTRRSREREKRCQSPGGVGGNQINGCISALCKIEFGSVGNLAEEGCRAVDSPKERRRIPPSVPINKLEARTNERHDFKVALQKKSEPFWGLFSLY